METTLKSTSGTVTIGGPKTILIGERINPTGKKSLMKALENGDFEILKSEALDQINAGADVLDINAGVPGMKQEKLLPEMVEFVLQSVDIPLCFDSDDSKALENTLKIYKGKPLINSVNGKENSINEILPLVKNFGTAVIALTMDDNGIPHDAKGRFEIAYKIVDKASKIGIPPEDIVIDCLTFSIGADTNSGLTIFETVGKIKRELGNNIILGASNISFGLPERRTINNAFISMAIAAGVNCLMTDVTKVNPTVLASDLILGRDPYAQRYTQNYKRMKSQ